MRTKTKKLWLHWNCNQLPMSFSSLCESFNTHQNAQLASWRESPTQQKCSRKKGARTQVAQRSQKRHRPTWSHNSIPLGGLGTLTLLRLRWNGCGHRTPKEGGVGGIRALAHSIIYYMFVIVKRLQSNFHGWCCQCVPFASLGIRPSY